MEIGKRITIDVKHKPRKIFGVKPNNKLFEEIYTKQKNKHVYNIDILNQSLESDDFVDDNNNDKKIKTLNYELNFLSALEKELTENIVEYKQVILSKRKLLRAIDKYNTSQKYN